MIYQVDYWNTEAMAMRDPNKYNWCKWDESSADIQTWTSPTDELPKPEKYKVQMVQFSSVGDPEKWESNGGSFYCPKWLQPLVLRILRWFS